MNKFANWILGFLREKNKHNNLERKEKNRLEEREIRTTRERKRRMNFKCVKNCRMRRKGWMMMKTRIKLFLMKREGEK